MNFDFVPEARDVYRTDTNMISTGAKARSFRACAMSDLTRGFLKPSPYGAKSIHLVLDSLGTVGFHLLGSTSRFLKQRFIVDRIEL